MEIAQVSFLGFLLMALLGVLLYGFSASEANEERDDSLKQKSFWKAALFGFATTLLSSLSALTAFTVSLFPIPKEISGILFLVGLTVTAILVLGWGFNEITAHRKSLPVLEVGNQLRRVERNLCYLVLKTAPDRRFSMDALYGSVCVPLGTPGQLGQVILARVLGEAEAGLFGEERVRELFGGMVPTKEQFAEHFVKEAMSRRVTVFGADSSDDVALPPNRLSDWPEQTRYLQIGDHDKRNRLTKFFDRLR